MKQVQKKHSAWLQTLLTVVLSVLIASAVWIGRYGVPLLGLPKAEDVQSVTLVSLDRVPLRSRTLRMLSCWSKRPTC